MRILFTRFPLESAYGGAEVQTKSLVEGLKKRGHDVTFIGSCPTLCEAMTNLQIPITKLTIGDPPVTKWGAVSFLWKKRRMKTLLIRSLQATSHKPQAIFMLSLSEKLLLTEWCTKHHIQVFWVEHDRIGRWFTHNPWLKKLKKLSTMATTIVVSSKSADMYRSLGWSGKLVTIPNGIDTTRFTPPPNPNPNPFHLGCIARLTHDKGVDLLIEAVRDLPDIRLTIIGTGREEQSLRSIATNYKLQTTSFQRSTNNISDFYHSLDCLVLPSRSHDPFGLVAAEAMACGIPVILTDVCGIASHLSKEEARIVRAGSAVALKEAIREIIEHPSLREVLSQKGPLIARERFSLSMMIDRYEALLLQKT